MGVLTVTLVKVMNLRDKDGLGRSDPYVVLELTKERLGFDKGLGKKTSSKKGGTCNPDYNETFTWEVDDLNKMQLLVKVKDSDIGMDDSLGHVSVDLDQAGLSSSPKEMLAVIDPKHFKFFSKEATIHLLVSFE